jgi:hypothetical protein
MSCRSSSQSPGLKRRVLAHLALASTLGLSPLSSAAAQEAEGPAEPSQDAAPSEAPEASAVEAPAPAPEVAPAPAPEPIAAVAVTTAVSPSPVEEAPADPPADAPVPEESSSWTDAFTISGYVEAYYAHNFNKPQNKTIASRWLDEQTGQFTLQTVVLDVSLSKGPLSGQVTLMFGPTADRWYFEGAAIKAGAGDDVLPENAWSNETWKHIQNAWVGYELPFGQGLTVMGGLFPTQVGYEPAPAKDNGNYSRSNIFTWFPFFHVGVRASYPLTEKLMLTAGVYNGYNQLRDLNKNKTMALHLAYTEDDWFVSAHYLGGKERPDGDPAGKAWRNMFDFMGEYSGFKRTTLAAHFDTGFENNELGKNTWLAGALYARFQLMDWLYLALRGDGIKEMGSSSVDAPVFFGKGYVLSGTATLELRPSVDCFSIRLEYRHDESDRDNPMYYTRGFAADGSQRLAATQNTMTVGLIGWF